MRISISLSWRSEENMDYQQVPQLAWSTQQWKNGRPPYNRSFEYQPRLLVSISLIIIQGLFLLLALQWAAWVKTQHIHPTAHAQNSTLVSQLALQNQSSTALATPTIQTTSLTPSPQFTKLSTQLDNFLITQVATDQFSGSVLIVHDGKILFSNGYSMADWDDQVPNTSQTKFHVGSLTKQFTAMAIMILQEQGKLHVQDLLCMYIPNCPAAWQPVTIQQILTHTSGIPQLDSPVPTSSPQDWFARYNNVHLAFAAGAQFSYCNVCYQILGYIIERVSREPYSIFEQQAIFNRLQMRNTGFDPDYLSLPDHAIGYQDWQVKADPDDLPVPLNMTFLYASGLL